VILQAGTFVGNDPFAVDDSYGPEVPPPGPVGALLRIGSLIHSFFGRPAYGIYLNSQQPNVTALLGYLQSEQGTLLQRIDMVNGSHQPLKVSVTVARADGRVMVIGPEWVSSGTGSLGLGEVEGSSGGVTSGILLGPDEAGEISVGIVASFNHPPLIRTIPFHVPGANTPIPHGH